MQVHAVHKVQICDSGNIAAGEDLCGISAASVAYVGEHQTSIVFFGLSHTI